MEIAEIRALEAVADDEEVEAIGELARELAEGGEERLRVFFLREPAHVEEQGAVAGDGELGAEIFAGCGLGVKDGGVHAEVGVRDVRNAPRGEEVAERGGRDDGAGEAAVEAADVAAGEVVEKLRDGVPAEFPHGADVGLGKVRVVKTDDRDAERYAGVHGFPGDLVRIAALDEVGALRFEDTLNGLQPQQHAVARGAGDERRLDGVGPGTVARDHLIPFAGNDEDVLVSRVLANEADFFGDVTFHPAADGGVELREIAELHAGA